MNLKKLFFLIGFLFFVNLLSAQIKVYKTYEDFQNGIAEEMDTYVHNEYLLGRGTKFVFRKNKKKVRFIGKKIWGFSIEDHLFRTAIAGIPYKLISKGKLCYYENGIAHLEMISRKKDSSSNTFGSLTMLSKSLYSELIPIGSDAFQGKYNKLKKKYPQYKSLYKCLEDDLDYKNFRKCFEEFNKIKVRKI